MKSAVEQAIRTANSEGRCAFIPFFTGGYPDEATCVEILAALGDAGSDVIEVGLPFSDPLADGPTIQASSQRALEQGITTEAVFRIVEKARRRVSCPLVVMTYVNPVFKMGVDSFAQRAQDAGISGVIIPDLPPEEAEPWQAAAGNHALDTIFLVAPTTPLPRLKTISRASRGFLYYVSMTGVTGSDFTVTPELLEGLRAAREVSSVPVAVGFGISTPEQAQALAPAVEGVIVGSALVKAAGSNGGEKHGVEAVHTLARSLRNGLSVGGPNRGNGTLPH